jgi:hypothetical protein
MRQSNRQAPARHDDDPVLDELLRLQVRRPVMLTSARIPARALAPAADTHS